MERESGYGGAVAGTTGRFCGYRRGRRSFNFVYIYQDSLCRRRTERSRPEGTGTLSGLRPGLERTRPTLAFHSPEGWLAQIVITLPQPYGCAPFSSNGWQ